MYAVHSPLFLGWARKREVEREVEREKARERERERACLLRQVLLRSRGNMAIWHHPVITLIAVYRGTLTVRL